MALYDRKPAGKGQPRPNDKPETNATPRANETNPASGKPSPLRGTEQVKGKF